MGEQSSLSLWDTLRRTIVTIGLYLPLRSNGTAGPASASGRYGIIRKGGILRRSIGAGL